MELNLNNLQDLYTEGKLTEFALNDLPSYPNSYTIVGLHELVEFESELRKQFRGISVVKGVNKYYYDFETGMVFLYNDYVGYRDSHHYKVSISEFPIDSDLDLYWFLENQEKDVLVGLLYKALKGE